MPGEGGRPFPGEGSRLQHPVGMSPESAQMHAAAVNAAARQAAEQAAHQQHQQQAAQQGPHNFPPGQPPATSSPTQPTQANPGENQLTLSLDLHLCIFGMCIR